MWKIKMSSVLSLVVNGEIHKDPNNMNKARRDFFFQMLSQETAATWLSLGFIWYPPLTNEVLSHIQLALIS